MDQFSAIVIKLIDAGFLSAIISAVTSFFVAKVTARHEAERLRESWAREDNIADQLAFSDMVAAVSRFIAHDSQSLFEDAVEKVAAYQASATSEMAAAVDDIRSQLIRHSSNTSGLAAALDSAVEQRRVSGSGKRPGKVHRDVR